MVLESCAAALRRGGPVPSIRASVHAEVDSPVRCSSEDAEKNIGIPVVVGQGKPLFSVLYSPVEHGTSGVEGSVWPLA